VKSKPLAWAILRPLLIAVAAAASWIVFSALGASADSSTSSDSPLGTGASTLSSVTTTVTRQAKDLQEPVEPGPGGGLSNAPASTVPTLVPAPSLRPVAEEVEGLAENVVETVPVVSQVVPAGTVAAVVDPAVGTVDGVASGTVESALPLAGAVLEPPDPVLEPVIGAVPLPAAQRVAPDPMTTAPAPAVVADIQPASDRAVEIEAETAVASPVSTRFLDHETWYSNGLTCDPRMKATAGWPTLSAGSRQDAPFRAPSDAFPAAPGATTGGSSRSGCGGSAMPAWLAAHHFQIPAAGAAAGQDPLRTAPGPVAFDPGSSPD